MDESLVCARDDLLLLRRLNDELRCRQQGGAVCISNQIEQRGPVFAGQVMAAVSAYNDFDVLDAQHRRGSVFVDGRYIVWHIEYLDFVGSGLSLDPTDPGMTRRVLVIMLAHEAGEALMKQNTPP